MDVIDTHCCAIWTVNSSSCSLARSSSSSSAFSSSLFLFPYCSGKQTSNRLEAIDDCSTLGARAGVHTPGHWLESSAAIIASWASDDDAAKFFFLFLFYSCFYLWSNRSEWKNRFRLSCGHLTFPRPIDEHLLGIISFIFILFFTDFSPLFLFLSLSVPIFIIKNDYLLLYDWKVDCNSRLRSSCIPPVATIEGFSFQMNDAWWSDVILFGIFLHDSMPMDRCTTNNSLCSIRRKRRSLWQSVDEYLRLRISKFRRSNQFNYRTGRTGSVFEPVSNESIAHQPCQWKR